VVEQEGQRLVNGWVFNQVIIVEDKHRVVNYAISGVDKSREHGIAVRRHAAEEQAQSAFSQTGLNFLPCRQQVAQEAIEVVILRAGR
jgi:hypothetical protein